MSDQGPLRISLQDPGELVAAIPYLIGFHPASTVILVALSGTDEPHITGLTSFELSDAADNDGLVHRVAIESASRGTRAAIVIVFGDGSESTGPNLPHHDLATSFDQALRAAGVEVIHTMWASSATPGGQWRCYDETDCDGHVPSPDQTPVAAATVAAGRVTYQSKDELDALFRLDDEASSPELAQEIGRFITAGERARLHGEPISQQFLQAVHGTIDEAHRGALQLDHQSRVALAVALSDPKVRDACICLGLTDRAAAAEQVWIALTKATPAPFRAQPALLLAASAYLRHDPVTADLALTQAIAAQPDSILAWTLRLAVDHGLPARLAAPDFLALAEDAQRLIEEEAATAQPSVRERAADETS